MNVCVYDSNTIVYKGLVSVLLDFKIQFNLVNKKNINDIAKIEDNILVIEEQFTFLIDSDFKCSILVLSHDENIANAHLKFIPNGVVNVFNNTEVFIQALNVIKIGGLYLPKDLFLNVENNKADRVT